MVDPDYATLPVSEHTELAILGAMLLDPVAVSDATGRLHADDFALDSHRKIYRTILRLVDQGQAVDITTVRAELERKRELDAVGGTGYIFHLTEGIPRNFSIESYVRIVKEKSLLRQLMSIGHDASIAAGDEGDDAHSLITRYRGLLEELGQSDEALDIPSVSQWLESQRKRGDEEDEFLSHMAARDGVRLGYSQWDNLTMGAMPGDLHIVAARPSMGKTAWMCCAAASCALRGLVVAVFSLEQKRKAMIRRMLSGLTRVELRAIQSGELRSEDRRALLDHRQRLADTHLYIDDTPAMTASRIRAKSSRLKRSVGLDVIFVDQLSHVSMADCKERDYRLKVGELTRAFKGMGQELGVPVVLFNQLRRPDGKGDPTPRLSDLKESGNIEEDADVVTLLHRPEYYDKADMDLRGKGQMIVAKNREGETGTLHCTFQGSIVRWEDDAQVTQEGFSYAER